MAKAKKTESVAAPEGPRQPNDIDMNYLGKLVDARQSGQPLYVKQELVDIWATHEGGPYVEFREDMKNDEGEIAARASESGVAYFNHARGITAPPAPAWGAPIPNAQPAQPQAQAKTKAIQMQPSAPTGPPVYQFETGYELPATTGFGRGRKVNYGFELMEIGQSFFVPATESQPSPIKKMSPVVVKANKDLNPKVFRPRTVTEKRNGEDTTGCRVWRIA